MNKSVFQPYDEMEMEFHNVINQPTLIGKNPAGFYHTYRVIGQPMQMAVEFLMAHEEGVDIRLNTTYGEMKASHPIHRIFIQGGALEVLPDGSQNDLSAFTATEGTEPDVTIEQKDLENDSNESAN